jgi:phosphohistidine phosphatase
MKTLFVLRHAKSSWDNPNQIDFERPLNERGLKTAPKMGEFMKEKDLVPDLIISSPAMRAKTTAQMVKDAGEFSAEIKFDQRIYEATVGTLLEVLNDAPESAERLLFVGHNPGFEDLVRNLTGEIREMPTAALAEIELKIENWKEIRPACGKLRNLFKPKEIAN